MGSCAKLHHFFFKKNMCSYFNRLKTISIASSILKLKKKTLKIIFFILKQNSHTTLKLEYRLELFKQILSPPPY